MKNLKILIVEDDLSTGIYLESLIKSKGYPTPKVALNGEECFAFYKNEIPDLLIADIDLGGNINGLEVAEKFYKDSHLPIIFLTGNTTPEFVKLAKKSQPVSFLSKPFNDIDILNAIELAEIDDNKTPGDQFFIMEDRIFIKKDNVHHKVQLNELLWLKAEGAYSQLNTTNHEFLFSITLNKLAGKINYGKLLRVHNSYIVNLDKVDGFQANQLIINKKKIPIGKKYQDEVKKHFRFV